MREMSKRVGAILLLLCVTIQMLPGARAEETREDTGDTVVVEPQAVEAAEESRQGVRGTPTSIAPVSVTVSAVTYPKDTARPGNVTVTTANIFFLNESGQADVYFAISGLPEGGNWIAVDTKGDVQWCQDQGADLKSFDYTVAAEGESSVTFTLRNDYVEENATIIYAPVTLTTTIASASALPPTQEELNGEPTILSNSGAQIGISAYVPLGGTTEGLRGVLTAADNAANIYAVSIDANGLQVDESSVQDTRYKEIFAWGPNTQIACNRIYFNGYCGKPLVVGNYNLLVYQEEKLVYTVPNAARVTDKPVITVMPAYDRPNLVGSQVAYGKVALAGGNISDVELQLYCDDQKIGGASAPRITQVYDGEIQATYTIALNEALQQSSEKYEFRAVSKSGKKYEGEPVGRLYPDSASRVKLTQGAFSGHIYANVVLFTQGADPTESYKFQLKPEYNGEVLSEVFASPDSKGVFDVEFFGTDGMPIVLQADHNYFVELFSWDKNAQGWSTYSSGSVNLSTYDMVAGEPGEPRVENFTNTRAEAGKFIASIGMDAKRDDLSKLDAAKFSLHMSSVTGETNVTLPAIYSREEYDGVSAYYTISANIPKGIPVGYYWAELFHNGAPLTDTATGKNWLKTDYAMQYNDKPDTGIRGWMGNNLFFSLGVSATDVSQTKNITLQLYAFGNVTETPDKTVDWNPNNGDMTLTDANAGNLDPTRRYFSEIYCDGVPVEAGNTLRYWMTEEARDKLDTMPHQPVTVTQASHGRLEAVSRAGSALNAAAPWSEVYLKSAPDAGYRLKSNSVTVNGKPIYGRTFLITDKPCTVTAEFEPIPVKTYSITQESNIYNGTLTVQKDAAEGETVVVTPNPEVGYAIEQIQYRMKSGNYVWKDITADKDGVYRLTMPKGDVVLTARFRYLQRYNVKMVYDYSMGEMRLDDSNPPEGGTVNVTVTPGGGYHLESISIMDGSNRAVATMETVEGCTFVMPASNVTITAVFAAGSGVSIGETADGMLIVKADSQEYGFALMVALYDDYGKMVGVKQTTGDGYSHCSVQIEMTDYQGAVRVKAFLLDGSGSLKPLIPAISHSVKS